MNQCIANVLNNVLKTKVFLEKRCEIMDFFRQTGYLNSGLYNIIQIE